MSQYRSEHQAYFQSDAGKELLKSLKADKRHQHEKAEASLDADQAFAFTQRARGVQEVLDVIQSMIAGGSTL